MTPEVLMLAVANIIATGALLAAIMVPLHLANLKRLDRMENIASRVVPIIEWWDQMAQQSLNLHRRPDDTPTKLERR